MVPDRLWYCTDCVVRGCPFSCTGPPDATQSFIFISGELQAGGTNICIFLSGVLCMTPQTLDSLRTLFVSYQHLAPKCQHSLSAVTLGIYLCDLHHTLLTCLKISQILVSGHRSVRKSAIRMQEVTSL
jgi:hypothetical protein